MNKSIQLFVFLFLMVISITSNGQNHPILDKFSVFEAGGRVYINCVISAGNTCNGIMVMRSEDSLYYEQIGQIDGVCGSSSEPIQYNFTDDKPIKNKAIYYKLELGGYGFTNPLSLKIIDTKEFGFQVWPNPSKDQTTVYFENIIKGQYVISVFNHLGVMVISEQTTQNYFKVEVSEIPPGIYPFVISRGTDNPVIFGKILVQH
ncbi:MAG: T9SS type A sorting domain-containing protein [bacterium]|nr:T9SS type A sorting domain-containing protein [bacterium]